MNDIDVNAMSGAEAVGYAAVHWRLTQRRGPARNHPCTDCFGWAAEWSYVGPPGASYSTNLDYYEPRCRSCHRKLDLGPGQKSNPYRGRGENHPQARLTTADVTAIRAAVAAGESQSALARRYGIGRQYVWDIKEGRARKYD